MSSALSYLQPGVRTDDSEAFKFFILLIIGGNVLIPIMVLASFVQGNKYSRSPIFMNFCIGWIVYSTGFLLLLYSGRWERDVEPIPWLCEVQAVLVYVLPIWVSATTNALVFELWIGVTGRRRSSSTDEEPRTRLPLRTLILLIFPYFCAISIAISASLVSLARRDLVGFQGVFCSVDFQPLRTTVSVLCILALGLGFGLQFDIGRRLYHCSPFGKARSQHWRDRRLFIRMSIFLIILAVGGLAAIFAGTDSYRYPRLIIQGLLPLSAWLVFGTKPAIYKQDSGSENRNL